MTRTPTAINHLRNAAFYRGKAAQAQTPAYRDHLIGKALYFIDSARAINTARCQPSEAFRACTACGPRDI